MVSQALKRAWSYQERLSEAQMVTCVGLARTIYIRCVYGIFGREITRYTDIYGVCIRFWPTLYMCNGPRLCEF